MINMLAFDAIRPFHDNEINQAIQSVVAHPMMKALMNFTFPDIEDSVWENKLKTVNSIQEFQEKFIYHAVQKIINSTSDGVSTSGFEKLEKETAYLFISNHRDIILDTSLLNASLYDHKLIMTASAIGDNLVKKPFLKILSKLNRNFLVQRGLPPRELLASSKLMSDYIRNLILEQNRSVWIAQREGRTKDGNDATHPGVLKMLAMAAENDTVLTYFKKIKIVPVSISYEYDPTDALKMPQLLALANNEVYIKEKNEDFTTLLSGIMGQKKGIHIHIGDVLDVALADIEKSIDNSNKQIQALAQVIDDAILKNYKLWPTNYIAYDLLHKTNKFEDFYSPQEKSRFEKRLGLKIDGANHILYEGFLSMYANPVVNKLRYTDGN
jgi:1-acyl-sn-glycerol-3-phosphate acyltransferase